METVKGTTKKQNSTDQPMKCKGCGRMFYTPYVDRKWVECPYCHKKH